MQMRQNADTSVKLNQLLRGELSAIATYSQAIEHIQEQNMINILEEAHNCHVLRANELCNRVREQGEEPATSAGLWGELAKAAEGGAQLFGDRATIIVLEEGEDRGLEQYTKFCMDDNPDIKDLARQFLPRQERTHAIMRELKISLSRAQMRPIRGLFGANDRFANNSDRMSKWNAG